MKKGISIILAIISLVVVGCSETTTTVISSTTTVYSFSVKSTFDATVENYEFTIDTVNRLIYNEDSMDYGTRVDSLIPVFVQTFTKVMVADTINLYGKDTVFIDFTNPQKFTVTSKTGDTASYWITVNVHTVPQDSFIWRKSMDFGEGVIERQKAVVTSNDKIYWLTVSRGEMEMMSSTDGTNWKMESVFGLPQSVDVEHLTASGDKLNIMDGNDLYSYSGHIWSKMTTTSDITLRHLLFTFRGEKYALGVGNVILKLVGTKWETAAELESGFPVEGECAFVGETEIGLPVAYISCGVDDQGRYLCDTWSSENGSHWVKLNVKDSVCTPRINTTVMQYGKGLLMIGGRNETNIVEDRILFSKDYGITWLDGDDYYELDTVNRREYCLREGHSMVGRSDGKVFVLGGRNCFGKNLGDIWKGLHYKSIPGFE